MKIVVSDACLFIDLHTIDLTDHFFLLDLEVHTTVDVLADLREEQRRALQPFRERQSLTAHNLDEADREAITASKYPGNLCIGDHTSLYLAEKIDAKILSSERVLRSAAGTRAIESHGLFWIFDQLGAASILSHPLACQKLKELMICNAIYRNNPKLSVELNGRLKKCDGEVTQL
ncbi:MAG: hypothetical protein P4L51_18330 [Puia sp.]|nr:hypothetical protein [Puia sp.]